LYPCPNKGIAGCETSVTAATVALSVADRGYVLQTGEIVLKDTAEKLREDEMVKKAYLGME
jgi:branched-chain amino acid transport system ATP-binding protein